MAVGLVENPRHLGPFPALRLRRMRRFGIGRGVVPGDLRFVPGLRLILRLDLLAKLCIQAREFALQLCLVLGAERVSLVAEDVDRVLACLVRRV